jgi:hypothetical protein
MSYGVRSQAEFVNDNRAPGHLSRSSGVRPSDRSGVGCSHTTECPLFPLLNTSLRGWRNNYCDSENGWLDCARYQLALEGKPVPMSLLPNGKQPQHLERFGSYELRQEPPSRPAPARPFEPSQAPTRPPEPSPSSRAPQPRENSPTGSRRSEPARRWWTRLADWMKGPA